MLPPQDRVPAANYREVALSNGQYLAVLPVRTPDWWTDRERVLVVKVDEHDEPVSCALTIDFT